MPLAFDTNGPISLDAINSYIGGYASPEAALMDTPLQSRNFLADRYQRLTGDPFSDPFESAIKNRSGALTEAAANGASVAVGSNTGGRLLSLPNFMAPNANANPATPIPTNVEGRPLSMSGQRTTNNGLLMSMMQGQAAKNRLASTDLAIPSPDSNNYLSVLEQRANLVGAGDLHRRIYQSNPDLFSRGTAADDPRFARVQGGKEGKVEAADALHPIAMDPTFIQETRRNPEKAKAYYSAVSGGRDYTTDITAKSQLLSEQSDARKKLIEGIKNVKADPFTGDLTKVVEVKNSITGRLEAQEIPLSDMEKSAIEAEGGFKRIYGTDIPNRSGIPSLKGASQEENIAYRDRARKLKQADPSLTPQNAAALAHRQLFQEQQNKGKVQPGFLSRLGSGIGSAYDVARSSVNTPAAILSQLMNKQPIDPRNPGNAFQLPSSTEMTRDIAPVLAARAAKERETMPTLASIMNEGFGYWTQ